MRALGLMSGTSMDGVDVAIIETDGESVSVTLGGNGRAEALGPCHATPYGDAERALLARAKEEARALIVLAAARTGRPGCLAEAERLVTERHAEAVGALLAKAGLTAADIDVIGFHGQTVLHRPEIGLTVQIGAGQLLADRLGIPVVSDFRAADVAAGGEGAPLVPVFHRALAQACGIDPPLAILNLGGVGNVTFIGEGDELVGFDTGPGNALVDDLLHEREGRRFDESGATAAAGRPDLSLVAWMSAHPYFERRPPKSLDRDTFSHRLVGAAATPDAAATLTAFTAAAVARALDWAPQPPRRWIAAGGGTANAEMMRLIAEAVGMPVERADDLGWSAEFMEAQAFAYLAARSLAGLPLTFPGTTGVAAPTRGGLLARPSLARP